MTQPENQAEALDRELSRLIGEYMDDDASDSTKAEAWNMIADFAVENARTIIAALAALPEAPAVPVGIKPLEWEETDERWWGASPLHGLCYEVRITDRGTTRIRWPENGGWEKFSGDLDLAKAAAQADFEARIRSALQSSSPVKAAAVDGEVMKVIKKQIILAMQLQDFGHNGTGGEFRTSAQKIALLEDCAERAAVAIAASLVSQNAVEGEAVAWSYRWRNEPWSFQESKPTAPGVIGEPLYASPRPAAADGVREAIAEDIWQTTLDAICDGLPKETGE